MNKPAKLQVWGGATSRTLRPHWMLHEQDIDYEAKLIGSRTGETQDPAFRKLNPKEKIPVLVDGDFILTESVAIVTYLGDHYGADGQPRLVPAPNTLARARYNEWMSFVQMELDAHTLYVIRKHRDLANLYGEAPAAVETAISGFDKQVGVAQQQLNRTPYLLGDDFSAADLILMTCLAWAKAYGLSLDADFDRYMSAIEHRSAYRQASKLNFSISPGA
jgi:glutathione S-transferase